MNNENIPTVLIGCSKNFRAKDFFTQKTNKYLSNFSNFKIIALCDKQSIIQECYGYNVIEQINYHHKISSIDRLLSRCDFAIYFWDGTDLERFIYRSIYNNIKTKIITIETTKVANKDKGDEYDIYIGRGSPWGNPFAIGDDGMSRDDVINKFDVYFHEQILSDPLKVKELQSLKGKTLGCHCKPSACHGDIIANYLNSNENT